MKLQVALDVETLDEAMHILHATRRWVDIAEIGTLGMFEGLRAIGEIKRAFPDLEVVADLKLPDGGEEGAEAAFAQGADYVTVMGVANELTITGAVCAARKAGRKVVADMITVQNFAERVKFVDSLGVDFIAVHTACDVQSADNTPLEQLQLAGLLVKNAGISVAGGINAGNILNFLPFAPDIIIAGAGIWMQDDPGEAARMLKEAMAP